MNKLESNKSLPPETIKLYRNLCIEGRIMQLYSQSCRLFAEKKYQECTQTHSVLQKIMLDNVKTIGIDENLLKKFIATVQAELRKNYYISTILIKEMSPIRKKIEKIAEEIFIDKMGIWFGTILYDTFLIPEICKAVKDDYQPKTEYEAKFLKLMKNEEYKEALGYVVQLREKKTLSEQTAEEWGKLCVKGLAVTLYSAGAHFMQDKQYDKAIKCLKELMSLIWENLALFNLEGEHFASLMVSWMKEAEKKTMLTMDEYKSLEERLLNQAREFYSDDDALNNIGMLLRGLFMPSVCESPKKDNIERN